MALQEQLEGEKDPVLVWSCPIHSVTLATTLVANLEHSDLVCLDS